jgi:spermidine synthase
MTTRSIRLPVLVLFFFSGASALAYEVIWVRELSLAFGVSVYAITAVLSAFMGGLALGSWLFGRLATRYPTPLRLYALLQLGIAICAVLSPVLIQALTSLYIWVYNTFNPAFYLFNLIRFGLAGLVLVVPATLMGGSFPVIGQFLARRETTHGRDLGLLYAANTIGGVVGALAAGLLLIRFLGASNTLFLAAGIDAVVALLAAFLSYQLGETRPADQARAQASVATTNLEQEVTRRRSRRAQRQIDARARAVAATRPTEAEQRMWSWQRTFIWPAFAASGFIALGYEVVWTRMLSIFILNTVYSFTIMLTTFLIGLALGSLIMARRADRVAQPLVWFGYLQLGIGLAAILMLYVFAKLPTIQSLIGVVSFRSEVASEFLAGGVTMIVPTLLIGATFPLAARLYTMGQTDVGARVGRLYGANTLGAMLGSFAAGFVLIPTLGLQRTAVLLAMLNLAIGTGALLLAVGRPRLRAGAMLGAAAIAAILLPQGVYLGFREGTSEHLVFYREGVDATVSVFEVKSPPLKISFVNGRSEVPTDKQSMRAFYLLGHLPALLHPEARSALMVSFGNGIATGTLARHQIPRIHAVEIVAEQVEAARFYRTENRGVLDYEGLELTIEDGRNYLLRSREQFDIVTADATHPVNSSSWALFTREFYQLARQRLTNDGVMIQWLPFHDLAEDDYRSIIKTFQSVFPHTTVWFTGGTHSFLVGTPGPLSRDDILALQPRITELGISDDLISATRLAEDLLMREDEVREYVAGYDIVHDDHAFFIPAQHMDRILASFEPYLRLAGTP